MSLNLRVLLRLFLFCHAFFFFFGYFLSDLKLTWFRTLFWMSVTAAPLLAMGLGWHAYTRRVITWFVCFLKQKGKRDKPAARCFPISNRDYSLVLDIFHAVHTSLQFACSCQYVVLCDCGSWLWLWCVMIIWNEIDWITFLCHAPS